MNPHILTLKSERIRAMLLYCALLHVFRWRDIQDEFIAEENVSRTMTLLEKHQWLKRDGNTLKFNDRNLKELVYIFDAPSQPCTSFENDGLLSRECMAFAQTGGIEIYEYLKGFNACSARVLNQHLKLNITDVWRAVKGLALADVIEWDGKFELGTSIRLKKTKPNFTDYLSALQFANEAVAEQL